LHGLYDGANCAIQFFGSHTDHGPS
jgi:hypothetical protein